MFDPNFTHEEVVSVGTSATSLSAGAARRSSILIQNQHATAKVLVGRSQSPVIRLSPDDSVEFSDVQGTIYAISDTAATDVAVAEFG